METRKKASGLLFTLGLLSASVIAQAPDDRKVETVVPGIEHIEIRQGGTSADRRMIHALVVDPQRAHLRLAQAMDEVAGAETTTSMAARHGALAAVNGGYFRTTGVARGEPMSLLDVSGRLLSEPEKGRTALAVADTGGRMQMAIVRVEAKAELKAGGRAIHPVHGLNRPREADEMIVFTPEFHRTTLTMPDGIEATIVRNRVTVLADGVGSQPIPRDGLIVSASGASRAWVREHLKRGDRVELKTEIKTRLALSFKPAFMLGAGPQLLAGGRFVAAEETADFSESLMRARHPRTAIGWRPDGKLVLVVVDGRQPASTGMTIEELAALMRELDCTDAMNLDGGGSTTMVIRNRIVNRPSDPTGERPVSDALLIVERRK